MPPRARSEKSERLFTAMEPHRENRKSLSKTSLEFAFSYAIEGVATPGHNETAQTQKAQATALEPAGELHPAEERRPQMHDEQTIPLAQYNALQALVGELLMTNQKLREQVALLAQSLDFTAPATHPQPRLGR